MLSFHLPDGSPLQQRAGNENSVGQGCFGMLNQADQLGSGCGAQRLGILGIGGQMQHLSQMDPVITDDGNIFRDPQSRFIQDVRTADIRIIVREENAAGTLR